MKRVGFVYDSQFLRHEPLGYHPERPARLTAILDAIEAAPELSERLVRIEPRDATVDEIAAVHDRRYIDEICEATPGHLDGDTYFSEGSLRAAFNAAGAVVTAVEACLGGRLDRAFCAVRPPGHHAERDHAMGFCIFNNIAVGAAAALAAGRGPVFIVDFDVHHGNGTQHAFYRNPDVFFFSTHQSPLYPGTGRSTEHGDGPGAGTTYNVPLPPGTGDAGILRAYEELLPPLVASFKPSLLMVSAGYDIRDRDPLASFDVTLAGVRRIVRAILDGAPGIPAVFTLEGGYDLDALSESVVATLEEMVEG